VNVSKEFDAGKVLNSIFGVYSLFNLMKVYDNPEGSLYQGLANTDLLFYIQSLVLKTDFGGVYLQKSSNDLFNGYESEAVKAKQKMNSQLGGAPWLNSKITVIKTENKPKKFNLINSGIYDSNRLRTLSSIEDNLYTSSEYQIFKSVD
jgi:hypothetical protein